MFKGKIHTQKTKDLQEKPHQSCHVLMDKAWKKGALRSPLQASTLLVGHPTSFHQLRSSKEAKEPPRLGVDAAPQQQFHAELCLEAGGQDEAPRGRPEDDHLVGQSVETPR